MDKTPTQIIEEALATVSVTHVFPDEKSALQWVNTTTMGLIRYKMSLSRLSKEERDAADPIEAGYLHAKDLGTRPRQQRRPWIDSLIEEVAEACFCEFVPLSGTMSSWLIGRHTDRQVAKHLLNSLVPTAERLAQDNYYREYHASRKAGEVEAARGSKERWLMAYVDQVKDALHSTFHIIERDAPEVGELALMARQDIIDYMNENFLPTRGNKTERTGRTNGKPKRIQG